MLQEPKFYERPDGKALGQLAIAALRDKTLWQMPVTWKASPASALIDTIALPALFDYLACCRS